MAKHCVVLGDLGRRSLLRTRERVRRKRGQADSMQIPTLGLHRQQGWRRRRSTWGELSLVPQMGAGQSDTRSLWEPGLGSQSTSQREGEHAAGSFT